MDTKAMKHKYKAATSFADYPYEIEGVDFFNEDLAGGSVTTVHSRFEDGARWQVATLCKERDPLYEDLLAAWKTADVNLQDAAKKRKNSLAMFGWKEEDFVRRKPDGDRYVHCHYRAMPFGEPMRDGIVEINEFELTNKASIYVMPADKIVSICASDVFSKAVAAGVSPDDQSWPVTFEIYESGREKWLQFVVDVDFEPRFSIVPSKYEGS